MKPIDNNSNEPISKLLDDLEKMQHYLLMVKAAALAFAGKFNEHCPFEPALSPFSKEETAEYFIWQFLDLDPDAKLEQAMELIQNLQSIRDLMPGKPTGSGKSNKPNEATIRISIDKD